MNIKAAEKRPTRKSGQFIADSDESLRTLALRKAEGYDFGKIASPRNLRVNMANSLVTAAQGLTLAEKRIVSLTIAKLDSYRPSSPNESPLVRLTVDDYTGSFDVDPTTAYEQLQVGSKRLYDRSIYFLAPKPGQDHPGPVSMRWISKAEYQEGLGYVEMRFAADLVPLLMNLRRQFTSYTLSQTSALRSVYSWRLLELLSQYESTGWLHTSVEDFGFAMDATLKQKENFAKIRSQIVEPAIKELTEKDGWLISWKPIKEGRRVVSIRFDFRRNPQSSLPL